jgi:hypothetical protein
MGRILLDLDLPGETATDLSLKFNADTGNKLQAGRKLMNLFRGLLAGARSAKLNLLSGAVQASSTVTADNAAADNTVVVNGVTFTAKVSPSGANQFAVGANDQAALENLATKINASALTGIAGVVEAEFSVDEATEVTTITAVADDSDSLDGTSFLLSDQAGTVGFWIDTDNSGTTIPTGANAADRAVEITTIATDDDDETVATKVAAAINADSEFSASADGAVVTVTAADGGAVADAEDAAGGEATGFTFAVATQGVDPVCVIRAKRSGLMGNAITLTATGGFAAGAAKLAGGTDGTSKTFYFGSTAE